MIVTDGVKRISLGIQGGGAFGAFGWGVLDRLLQEERLEIGAISGTSAGAVNAAVLADGYARGGGRAGARAALQRFWHGLSAAASAVSPVRPSPFDWAMGGGTLATSPGYQLMQLLAGVLAPPASPLSMNPMQPLLATLIDFERVRACEELQVFVTATNVRTGRGKVFTRAEMDVQRVVASACLPTVFAAVEVEGESYWDGSFAANPPLAPLVEAGGAADLLIVQINPIERSEMPRNVADISNRANEIAFNTSFVREVNALLHTHGVPSEEGGADMTFSPVRLHLVTANDFLTELSVSSKFNAEMGYLQMLHDRGVAAAEQWLEANLDDVGRRNTLDPAAVFRFG